MPEAAARRKASRWMSDEPIRWWQRLSNAGPHVEKCDSVLPIPAAVRPRQVESTPPAAASLSSCGELWLSSEFLTGPNGRVGLAEHVAALALDPACLLSLNYDCSPRRMARRHQATFRNSRSVSRRYCTCVMTEDLGIRRM